MIVFNGAHKMEDEVKRARTFGIYVNLDSINNATRLNALAKRYSRLAVSTLRITPGVVVHASLDTETRKSPENIRHLLRYYQTKGIR